MEIANKIIDSFNENSLLVFFKLKDNYYFYFRDFYQFNGDTFVKIDYKPELEKKVKFSYQKKIISLSEISDSSDICFCYKILGIIN